MDKSQRKDRAEALRFALNELRIDKGVPYWDTLHDFYMELTQTNLFEDV